MSEKSPIDHVVGNNSPQLYFFASSIKFPSVCLPWENFPSMPPFPVIVSTSFTPNKVDSTACSNKSAMASSLPRRCIDATHGRDTNRAHCPHSRHASRHFRLAEKGGSVAGRLSVLGFVIPVASLFWVDEESHEKCSHNSFTRIRSWNWWHFILYRPHRCFRRLLRRAWPRG